MKQQELIFDNNETNMARHSNMLEDVINDHLSKSYSISVFRNPKLNKAYNLKELGWKSGINKRKRAAGLCSFKYKTIYLSEYIFSDLDRYMDDIINTILHEIAHAIDYEVRGKSSHDKTWKAIANDIGCDGNRVLETSNYKMRASKYTSVCPKCGHESSLHRIKKRNPKNHYVCRRCYERFSAKYGRNVNYQDPTIKKEIDEIKLRIVTNY